MSSRLAIYLPDTPFTRGGQQMWGGAGTFTGVLKDGIWTSLEYDIRNEDGPITDMVHIFPLVGAIDQSVVKNLNEPPPEPEEEKKGISIHVSTGDDDDGDDPSDTINLLRDSIEEWWDSTIRTSYARWDASRGGVELIIEVPISDRRNADVMTATAFFPNGGTTVTALDSVMPERMTFGDWPLRVKVMNGQLHLRGRKLGDRLLPTTESWSAVAGAMGFTAGFEQRIVYTEAARCAP